MIWTSASVSADMSLDTFSKDVQNNNFIKFWMRKKPKHFWALRKCSQKHQQMRWPESFVNKSR